VGSRWDDKNIWQGERIARAATFLATALDKHRPLVKFLDKAPARLRRVGYECLWPNGRMRVYDILEEAAGDDDPAIRRAVAMGFAYVGSLKPDEVAKACELLRRLLADPRGEVAAAAAERLADLCPDSRDKVVQTIAEHLERRSLEPGFITALERLHRATTVPTSTPLKKKAERLLGRIARTRKLQAALRVMALQSLARLTPDTAHKLARRLARDRDATVRRAAENLK
jgi:hypothetical protein